MIIIQLTPDEFTKAISEAVRSAMPTQIKEATPQPFIKGIHQLATFLKVSPARAQKLKNENAFPFWQDGRTLLFDPDKVRESMQKFKK